MNSKLREALEKVSDILETWSDHLPPIIQDEAKEALALADEALAEPVRNCDVGTPQEQIKQWGNFCLEHHEHWKPGKSLTAIQICNCPCYEGNSCNYFIWAQMPYKEEREMN